MISVHLCCNGVDAACCGSIGFVMSWEKFIAVQLCLYCLLCQIQCVHSFFIDFRKTYRLSIGCVMMLMPSVAFPMVCLWVRAKCCLVHWFCNDVGSVFWCSMCFVMNTMPNGFVMIWDNDVCVPKRCVFVFVAPVAFALNVLLNLVPHVAVPLVL